MTDPPLHQQAAVADDLESADPGLARERTRLAWTRSSISFAAIGVVLLKDQPLIGAPVLILSATVWSVGLMRQRVVAKSRAAVATRRVQLVTAGVLVVAAAALAIALVGHSHGLRG